MNKVKKLILMLLIILCNGCDGCNDHYSINFYNNSEKTIFIQSGGGYPDTMLTNPANFISSPFYFHSNKKDTANYIQWIKPFQKTILYPCYDTRTLYIMILR